MSKSNTSKSIVKNSTALVARDRQREAAIRRMKDCELIASEAVRRAARAEQRVKVAGAAASEVRRLIGEVYRRLDKHELAVARLDRSAGRLDRIVCDMPQAIAAIEQTRAGAT
ncbi:MAG TPA: hypothetical protein VGM56_26890 [Byssovorax sp.]|jgi:hypothetical protein